MSESLTNEELDWLEKELKPDHDLEQWLIFVGKLWEENASALISMARRCLSAEERLEKAVEALVKISSGTMECGHCTRGETTPEELATETLLKLKGLGTPKELRPRQECAPHVEPDVPRAEDQTGAQLIAAEAALSPSQGTAGTLPQTEGREDLQATFYMGKWYCFDNFSPFSVVFNNKVYPTAEHLYQALKFKSLTNREMVSRAQSAHAAKKLAKSLQRDVREDWDDVKISMMETVCGLKMVQHEYVQKTLLKSGDLEIIESSPVDSFWGWGPDKKGRNELGKIWMRLRDELKAAPAPVSEKGGEE
jgi:ribA/ribD-fused uncharacterized protein